MACSRSDLSYCLQRPRCRFPTALKGRGRQEKTTTLCYYHSNLELDSVDPSADLIEDAWAILLRSYTQSDVIHFVHLRKDCSHIENGENGRSGSQQSWRDDRSYLWKFNIPGHLMLESVRVNEKIECSNGFGELKDVNTGVERKSEGRIRHLSENPEIEIVPDESPGSVGIEELLDLVLVLQATAPQVSFKYRQSGISLPYMSSIAANFESVVRSLCDRPRLMVESAAVVSDSSQLLMKSWNPPDPWEVKMDRCMHHLVDEKAQRIPENEAVCAWDGSFTYKVLAELSDIVARHLCSLGIGPGDFVPFAFEKSKWTVVATLGILKAGAAFVPCNAYDPLPRLCDLFRVVGARAILTSLKLADTFNGLVEYVIAVPFRGLVPDSLANDPAETQHHVLSAQTTRSKALQQISVRSNDPIFVLFTSGSTGQPKGIIHTHSSICTHAMVHGESMGYHGARVLQFAAHTFDVAIIDIYTTLLFGGCVCIPSEEDRRNNIIGVINTMKVDYAILTPSFAGLIEPKDVPTLETLAIGGEALPQDRIESWVESVRFIQIYGPAEAGICLTQNMSRDTLPEKIGYPLSNSSCWLVDPENPDLLVPPGAVGELVIAGPSVTTGYLKNDAKNQVSFLHDPLWATRSTPTIHRFYRSGDLLRYNLASFDGSFDFVGRKDSQIKLFGQRIEPGEVEFHVGRIPGVALSMVTKPQGGCFDGQLVAVIQMQDSRKGNLGNVSGDLKVDTNSALTTEFLRDQLSSELPSYMRPSVCIVVNRIPLVPSLKIDRRVVGRWLQEMDVAPWPQTPVILSRLRPEEKTSMLISAVISKSFKHFNDGNILEGSDFNIQQTGLDSIQIISLLMQIKKIYGKSLSVNALLNPEMTVRRLSEIIDTDSVTNVSDVDPGISDSLDILREINICAQSPLQGSIHKLGNAHVGISTSTNNILLTGATGYLGIEILHQLMTQTKSHVFAIVRCINEESGFDRLISTATREGWWTSEYGNRIHIWPGNMQEPSLGLAAVPLSLLQRHHIDHMIHNAAVVHYTMSYHALRACNVLSTKFLLEAMQRNPSIKSMTFVSGGEKPNLERSPSEVSHQSNGYAQSKFVAEALVRRCSSREEFRGRTLSIVKPGYIMGTASNGSANQRDFLWRLVGACIEIGAYNLDEKDRWLFISNVGHVSRQIVEGLVRPFDDQPQDPSTPMIRRILDGLRFSDLWGIVESEVDCHLEALEGNEWMRRIQSRVLEVGETHLLYPLLHTLEHEGTHLGEDLDPVGNVELTKNAVRSNIRRLLQIGFLPRRKSIY